MQWPVYNKFKSTAITNGRSVDHTLQETAGPLSYMELQNSLFALSRSINPTNLLPVK